MIGITIALLIIVYYYAFTSVNFVSGFLSATHFLWVWWWIWAGIFGLYLIIKSVRKAYKSVKMKNYENPEEREPTKFEVFAATTIVSIVAIILLIIPMSAHAMLLAGVHMLMTAGTNSMSFGDFSSGKLIIGAIMILIGTGFTSRMYLSIIK